MDPSHGSPTAPIAFPDGAAAARSRRRGSRVGITASVMSALRDACPDVTDDAEVIGEASRDWWPLAMTWALRGEVAARAAAVARPTDHQQVADLLAGANRWALPVTTAGGRSGVCGASVPLYGGLVLDMCGLTGIRDVDDTSLVVDVAAGTFGDIFEATLRDQHALTCGHWPQSMALSTVGGWLACRGAGQMSTRYGKIEDIVIGLDVVLADGTTIHTGGFPAAATGPDLTQVFVGSEGTLGVITGARLTAHPAPTHSEHAAWTVGSFAAGLELFRRVLRRGATPAVLRLYDGTETQRNYGLTPDRNAVIVLDEGDPTIVAATMAVVREEAASLEATAEDPSMVGHWLSTRNDVAALENLISEGFVVDTMEVAAPWSKMGAVYDAVIAAIGAVEGTMAVSAHCSHSYTTGGCVYFTFGGRPPTSSADGEAASSEVDAFYRAVWDAGTRAALGAGASLAHHHGVGLNRGRYMDEALGAAADVLPRLKEALDPSGILNPGKLGLPSRFGSVGLT